MTEGKSDKSPKLYLDYDQQGLDRAYDQRVWASNAEEIIGWYPIASAEARRSLQHRAGIAYGDSHDETFDLFPAAGGKSPVVIFVHGGAWRQLSKDESAFAAPLFVGKGVSYVALDFGVIPSVRLPDMVAQVRRAIAYIWREADRLGVDRGRIYLCGHSSGAHLTAMAVVNDWEARGLPANAIAGALCASGSYDLEPVMLSARGKYLELTAEEEQALSPIRFAGRANCKLTVAYGGNESPEFKRQGEAFHTRLRAAGRDAGLIVAPGFNHFEISKTLATADGVLARAMLDLIGK